MLRTQVYYILKEVGGGLVLPCALHTGYCQATA